jgi:uncharacterized membrane protein
LPALVLAVAAWLLKSLTPGLRKSLAAASLGLGSFWLFASIRYFWQWDTPHKLALSYGMSQPELYTYTVVLLIAGAGCFYQALARGSDQLRRVATQGKRMKLVSQFVPGEFEVICFRLVLKMGASVCSGNC